MKFILLFICLVVLLSGCVNTNSNLYGTYHCENGDILILKNDDTFFFDPVDGYGMEHTFSILDDGRIILNFVLFTETLSPVDGDYIDSEGLHWTKK